MSHPENEKSHFSKTETMTPLTQEQAIERAQELIKELSALWTTHANLCYTKEEREKRQHGMERKISDLIFSKLKKWGPWATY